MIFTITGPHYEKSAACEPVLRGLPEWFGIEAAIVQYAAEIDALPTFLASTPEGVLGFLSLKQHNPYAAEILVMGVKEDAHRQGTGRALVVEAEKWLLTQGVEYLQVENPGAVASRPRLCPHQGLLPGPGLQTVGGAQPGLGRAQPVFDPGQAAQYLPFPAGKGAGG